MAANDQCSESESPEFFQAFRDLALVAEGLVEYHHSDAAIDDYTSVLRDLARASMVFRHHKSSTKNTADAEFLKLTKAGMAYANSGAKFQTMDIRDHRYIPQALQTMYIHMGLAPIDDVAFHDMTLTYRMGGWCQRHSFLDMVSTSILMCRDVPLGVKYMHETSNHLRRLNDIVFSDLTLMAKNYLEYSNEYDNWTDPEVAAFRDFSKVVEYISYECPDYQWFRQYLKLPTEVRELVMHEYLLLEREAGRLSKHQHYDEWSNPCCKWAYPDTLIACDNQNKKTFPDASTGRCPAGWLPNLAFTSRAMHDEVLIFMLHKTERFDLKYIYRNTGFKIATWFREFLEAIPGDASVRTVRHLAFPHMHWFNHQRLPPAPTNPSIELAVACTNLRQLDMTFHSSKVTICNQNAQWIRQPLPLTTIINRFKLQPIFCCENLEHVYIDSIHDRPSLGGKPSDLDVVEDLSKWMMKGFLMRRYPNKGIEVELVRRWGAWRGRVAGDLVALNEQDMKDVEASREGTC